MLKFKQTIYPSLAVAAVISLTFSCGPKKIDPTALPVTPQDRQIAKIPDVCKPLYESIKSIPKVAVLDFTNNTTFDAAKVLQAHGSRSYKRVGAGVGGVVVGPTGVGVGYAEAEAGKERSQLEAVSRNVNAKLGESVAEGVAATLVEMGGAKVYTRRDLKKVLQEQQFQQSGLADEKTLVQLGKLAGVRYIITGSVNNVNLKWIEATSAKQGLQKHLGLVGSVLAAGIETQEGWNISTDLTIKVIDVQTGEVVLAKNVSGRQVIGKTPTLSFDMIIGGIKKAAEDAINDAKTDLSKYFKIRGYILQTRTAPDKSKRYALINMGSKLGVKPGQEFYVYTFEKIVDPLTNKADCDMVKLPITLEATNQVETNKSWTIVKGDENQIMRVKAGQIVERVPIKSGLF